MTKGAIIYVEDNNENRALIRRVRDARIQVQEYTDHRLDCQRDAGDREKSLQAGCVGYIQKPIDIDIIAQQIERYLMKR